MRGRIYKNYGKTIIGILLTPDLYYVLLRLWNVGVKTGDFEWIKQRGLGLNLVFFVLSFCIVGVLGYLVWTVS